MTIASSGSYHRMRDIGFSLKMNTNLLDMKILQIYMGGVSHELHSHIRTHRVTIT